MIKTFEISILRAFYFSLTWSKPLHSKSFTIRAGTTLYCIYIQLYRTVWTIQCRVDPARLCNKCSQAQRNKKVQTKYVDRYLDILFTPFCCCQCCQIKICPWFQQKTLIKNRLNETFYIYFYPSYNN